jgi:hypothetical protein
MSKTIAFDAQLAIAQRRGAIGAAASIAEITPRRPPRSAANAIDDDGGARPDLMPGAQERGRSIQIESRHTGSGTP